METENNIENNLEKIEQLEQIETIPAPKKRGRPKKNEVKEVIEQVPKRPVGRPRKYEVIQPAPKRPSGRPRKIIKTDGKTPEQIKEEKKKYFAEYYKLNKERMILQMNKLYHCNECNMDIANYRKSKHVKTLSHKKNVVDQLYNKLKEIDNKALEKKSINIDEIKSIESPKLFVERKARLTEEENIARINRKKEYQRDYQKEYRKSKEKNIIVTNIEQSN